VNKIQKVLGDKRIKSKSPEQERGDIMKRGESKVSSTTCKAKEIQGILGVDTGVRIETKNRAKIMSRWIVVSPTCSAPQSAVPNAVLGRAKSLITKKRGGGVRGSKRCEESAMAEKENLSDPLLYTSPEGRDEKTNLKKNSRKKGMTEKKGVRGKGTQVMLLHRLRAGGARFWVQIGSPDQKSSYVGSSCLAGQKPTICSKPHNQKRAKLQNTRKGLALSEHSKRKNRSATIQAWEMVRTFKQGWTGKDGNGPARHCNRRSKK